MWLGHLSAKLRPRQCRRDLIPGENVLRSVYVIAASSTYRPFPFCQIFFPPPPPLLTCILHQPTTHYPYKHFNSKSTGRAKSIMPAHAPENPDPPKTGPNDSIFTKIYQGEYVFFSFPPLPSIPLSHQSPSSSPSSLLPSPQSQCKKLTSPFKGPGHN